LKGKDLQFTILLLPTEDIDLRTNLFMIIFRRFVGLAPQIGCFSTMNSNGEVFIVSLVRLDEEGNDVEVHVLQEGNTVFGRGKTYKIKFALLLQFFKTIDWLCRMVFY
jgi:hypothetical protein